MKKSEPEEQIEIIDDRNLIGVMLLLLYLFEIYWIMNKGMNTC